GPAANDRGGAGLHAYLDRDHRAGADHEPRECGQESAPAKWRHQLLAQSLRIAASLMAKWPRHPGRRREMIFISDGEEHNGGNDANNVTFKTAVQDTVASNVVAYTILVTGAPDNMSSGALGVPLGAAGVAFGALKAAQTQTNNGSENLGVLAEATGGEAYSQGDGTPARLEQFLKDIGERLANQYTLGITPAPSKGETMVGLKVEVKDTKAKITAPKQIVLPQKSN